MIRAFLLTLLAIASLASFQAPAEAQWAVCGTGGKLCSGGDVYFGSGTPTCDVMAAHPPAVPDGVTDNSASFENCRSILNAKGGGVITAPVGTFCLFTGYTNNGGARIRIRGAGQLVTVLSACGHDVNVIAASNTGFNGIEDLTVYGKGAGPDVGTFGATKSAVLAGTNSGGFLFRRVYVNGGKYACEVNNSNDDVLEDFVCAQGYSGNLYVNNSPGTRVRGGSVDASIPGAAPTFPYTFNNRANTTFYALHTIVKGVCPDGATYYWQAVVAGTSGGSNPTCKNYLLNFVDGTAQWQVIAPTQQAMFRADGGIEIQVIGMDISGFAEYNFWASNNGGSGAPQYVTLVDSTLSGGVKGIFFAEAGAQFALHGNHLRGCFETACFGLGLGNNWLGGMLAQGNFFQFTSTGVVISGSALGYNVIDGNYASNNVSIDYYAAPGAAHFAFTNNNCGGGSAVGVEVDTGASNDYTLSNNICTAATAPIIDNGTGIGKTLVDNNLGGTGIAGAKFGTAFVGSWPGGTATSAFFGNSTLNQAAAGNYALIQVNGGATVLNAAATQPIDLRIGNVQLWRLDGSTGGLFANAVTGGAKGTGTVNAVGVYDGGNRVAISASGCLSLSATTGALTSPTCGSTASGLNQFASTTSAQFFGVISDETGGGVVVGSAAPTFTTSITDPLVIGGTGAASTLEMRATSGVGAGSEKITFGIGNNGGTVAGFIQAPAAFTGIATSASTMRLGTLCFGDWPASTGNGFVGHCALDHTAAGNYAFIQNSSGASVFNSASGQSLSFRIANTNELVINTTTATFTPAVVTGTYLQTGAVAVASLPTCNSGAKGARHFVTDSNAAFTAGIGAVVAAGGANNVPVTCDGTNWRIG